MKFELNIEKDEELRQYIKQCILDNVKSLTREEVRNIIKETIEQ